MDRIYAIVHRTRKEAYLGRTSQALEARWNQHLRDAANPFYEKRLSEALRHEPLDFDIIECEHSDTASEADWMQRFADDGYELLNTAGGNKKPPAARRTDLPSVADDHTPVSPEEHAKRETWLRHAIDEFRSRVDWKALLAA